MRALLSVFFIISFLLPNFSFAVLKKTPFGGTVIIAIPCVCSNVSYMAVFVKLTKAPYLDTFLWKPPTTKPKANYFPFPGGGILGWYSKGGNGQCRVGVQPYCYTITTKKTLNTVGTGGLGI